MALPAIESRRKDQKLDILGDRCEGVFFGVVVSLYAKRRCELFRRPGFWPGQERVGG